MMRCSVQARGATSCHDVMQLPMAGARRSLMHVLNAATAALLAQTTNAIAVIAQRNSMLANEIRDFTDVYLEVSSSLRMHCRSCQRNTQQRSHITDRLVSVCGRNVSASIPT